MNTSTEKKEENLLEPFLALLRERGHQEGGDNEEISSSIGFSELRGHLISQLPLDTSWIRRVNAAEAEYWRRESGHRVDYSDRILGFECGGAQWVNEVCFPVKWGSLVDIDYVMRALQIIESCGLPAPSPIEQRWTSSSTANMSPAYCEDPTALYSWVGIIMYLPTTEPDQRKRIAQAFIKYRDACKVALWEKYGCAEHWAKIEKPKDELGTKDVRERIWSQYPIADFNAARHLLDPKSILANQHLEILLSHSSPMTDHCSE